MGLLANVYATDEDIAVRCTGDYAQLVPDHQLVSRGIDGTVFAVNPWVLNSATGNFVGTGVQPGMVLRLEAPYVENFGSDGDFFAVDSVEPTSLTLRRIGLPAGTGASPCVGNVDRINYLIRTFGPQIEDASFDLDQRFRLDPNSQFWGPANLYDQRQLRQACVLTVLLRQYTSETRAKGSDWDAKCALAAADLKAILERISLKWGPLGNSDTPRRLNSGRVSR